MCASFVSCHRVLMEKTEENGSLWPSLTFPFSDHFLPPPGPRRCGLADCCKLLLMYCRCCRHYSDVIIIITSVSIIYSTFCSGAYQRKHQSVTGLCVGNSPVTGEFPSQRASDAENVSIWWRHHGSWVSWSSVMTRIPFLTRISIRSWTIHQNISCGSWINSYKWCWNFFKTGAVFQCRENESRCWHGVFFKPNLLSIWASQSLWTKIETYG